MNDTFSRTERLRSLPRRHLSVLSSAILAACVLLLAARTANAAPNPIPTWNVDDPILFRTKAEPFDHFAVKDPTIVFTNGQYHMFYTGANASGGWQMLYSTATTLEGFRTAPHVFLTRIGGHSDATSIWVRAQTGTPSAKATLALTANGTTSFVSLTSATTINASGWTRLSGTATVSWAGTLTSATLYVETTAGTDGLFIDDASFQ